MSDLSDFAKEIIRECAKERLNVYETYKVVNQACTKSGYTIEQVGKYLRRVTRAIIRKETTSPLHPLAHKYPLRTSLSPYPLPLQTKTVFLEFNEYEEFF